MSDTWREELALLAEQNGVESLSYLSSDAGSDDSDSSESSSDDKGMGGEPPQHCLLLPTPASLLLD